MDGRTLRPALLGLFGGVNPKMVVYYFNKGYLTCSLLVMLLCNYDLAD